MQSLQRALYLLWALAAVFAWPVAAQSTDVSVSVFYKPLSEQSARRVDTGAQSALLALEEGLVNAGLKVMQPDAAIYAQMDRSPAFVVNFAHDSGLVVLLDAATSSRPNPGTDTLFAEVRLRARLYLGPRLLQALSTQSQLAYRATAETKAFEQAAARAAAALARQLADKMAAMDPGALADSSAALAPTQEPVVSAAPAVALPAPRNRFAVLVGVGDFSRTKWGAGFNLPDTVRDVNLMEQTLLRRGVPKENITRLVDENASSARVRAALRDLQSRVGSQDQVIVFMASHGMPKDEGIRGFGYPVLYDTHPDQKQTVVDFEEIRQLLAAQPARQIVWMVDTCHAGGAAAALPVVEFSKRGMRITRGSGEFSAAVATVPAGSAGLAGRDVAVLTAAREDQESMGDGVNGIFTSALAAALAQAAPNTALYQIYQQKLEQDVPNRRRVIEGCGVNCKPSQQQQPGFGAAGAGRSVGL